jgi:large subunit ribosomal protein L29
MKIKEFENLSVEELGSKIKVLKEDLFKLNMQRYTGNVDKPHMFSSIKKDIARIKTLLHRKKEKKNG